MSVWRDKLDELGVTHHWSLDGTLTARVGGLDLTATGAGVTTGEDGLLRWEEGESAYFDGTGGQLAAADNAALEPAGEFTVGCVIRPHLFDTGDYQSMVRKASSYYMVIAESRAWGGGIVTQYGVHSPASVAGLLLAMNTYLVGMSLERPAGDDAQLVCYVNGEEVARLQVPEDAALVYDTAPMRWGQQDTADQPMHGWLDEPFLFNDKALSIAEWGELWDAYAKAPRVPFQRRFNRIKNIAGPPTDETLEESARRCEVIVLQPWEADVRDRMKAANPDCQLLAYQNFGCFSTSRNEPTGLSASLVNYDEAAPGQPETPAGAQAGAHPDWFLHSIATGLPFVFDDFPSLFTLNPANDQLRALMAVNALTILDAGWDGIFADDVNGTMHFHHDENDIVELPDDIRYGEAVIGLMREVRTATIDRGKLLIPNIGSWTGYVYWGQQILEQCDGGFDEFRGKFGSLPADDPGYETDQYRFWSSGWIAEQLNQAYCEYHGKLYLSSTFSFAGDSRAAVYGYASVLLTSEGRSFTGFHHSYAQHDWFPEYDLDIGQPLDPPVELTATVHAFVRRFTKGVVAINPTNTDGLVADLGMVCRSDAGNVTQITLDSHTAVVLEAVPRIRVRELPPLRQHTEVRTPSGRRYRWSGDEPDPANVPSGLRHSSTMPGGFESLDVTLRRKPGIDYTGIERLATITTTDAGGEVTNQCRLERAPRVSGDQMAISPSAVGWQAHLEDDKSVRFLGIDRALNSFQGMSRERLVQAGATYSPQTDGQVTQDPITGQPALRLDVSGQIAGSAGGFSEIFYDAGAGQLIGEVHFESTERRNIVGALWDFHLYAADDDVYTAFVSVTGDLGDTSVAFRRDTLATAQRWIVFQLLHGATYTGDELERWRMIKRVAVIGDHGIPLRETDVPGEDGLWASDIIAYVVARWAPLLVIEPGSIEPSGIAIPHFTYPELTNAGELVRQANRIHLNDWAVWEGRRFVYHSRGARGRRWRARIGPAQLEETGPQTDRLWESIIVAYQDVDGTTRTVGPPGSGADTETDALRDPDPQNPASQLGIIRRDALVMGIGTVRSAQEVGVRFLEQTKLLDSSGRARLVGHVMDDRGVLHPYHRVRAGDQISFLDASDTSYRRIVRPDHSDHDRTCTIDIDAPPEGLAALLEQLGVVLVPLGL